jgi:hypothetical protein
VSWVKKVLKTPSGSPPAYRQAGKGEKWDKITEIIFLFLIIEKKILY